MNEANGKADSNAASKDAAGWADLKIYYAAAVDPDQARVIARLTDGTPLLMEKQIGEGHVLLFASGLDNLTNDLPVRPAFVPFVDRTARYLSGSGSISGSRLVDSFVPLRTATAQAGTAGVEIIGPDGHRALSLDGGRRGAVVPVDTRRLLPDPLRQWQGRVDRCEPRPARVRPGADSQAIFCNSGARILQPLIGSRASLR